MDSIHQARNCLYCNWFDEIYNGWGKFLHENAYRIIQPNPSTNPKTPPDYLVLHDLESIAIGHLLVISKEPFDDICDASEDAIQEIGKIILKYSQKIRQVLHAEKVYVSTICDHYDKRELGKDQSTTEHLHFHLIPRYPGAPKGEVLFSQKRKKAGIDLEATPLRAHATITLSNE